MSAGLRSSAVGEQCEAIVKCPALMDKFPFPVMTSTALLKLADVFSAQATGNLLRLHILRVFQLAQRHLGKVANTEELVRRLSLVSHSNDPVARALTLRSRSPHLPGPPHTLSPVQGVWEYCQYCG